MNSPLAVGIVGYGYWGPNLARNLGKLAGSRLCAVCDIDPLRLEHVKRSHPGVRIFKDFGTMLGEVDLDAVVVSTPIRSHHPLSKAALLAGKHVLVEKPMAASVAECEELIQLATDRRLLLMVGHTYLYSEAVRKILTIVQSGEIGEVKYINCQRLNLGLFQQDINVAWDLAPHDLSIILSLMGELPERVNCQGNSHVFPGIEDVVNISLSFGSGRFATIQNSWIEPRKVRQMTFVGTRKMIVYDDLQPLEKIRIYDVRVDRPPHYDSFAEFQYSYHYGDCLSPRIAQGEPLQAMCSHFVSCVRSGHEPLSGAASGLDVVRILEACDKSLDSYGSPICPIKMTCPDRQEKRRHQENCPVSPMTI